MWTGDSARHDSDEKVPRNADQVLDTNRWIVEKFEEVFSTSHGSDKAFTIPIISTFGNNDVLPHNILLSGPNKWLKAYTDIWSKFIPEEQRHGFERGGWYYVEVIPKQLAVFSLNTLYFFDNNAAVDGCDQPSEPGYEHMEWLRIQLQFMRERGMKAILMGHVPPARTNSKKLWDETCWQKYTLWLQQYRDVVVGGLYGHMNIDHFMLHDTKEVNMLTSLSSLDDTRTAMDDDLDIMSASDYLEELRNNWAGLPNPAVLDTVDLARGSKNKEKEDKKDKKQRKKKKKQLKKIGGPWGERYHVTHVAPSVVPNYFPTLRVMEYNITGLDKSAVWANSMSWSKPAPQIDIASKESETEIIQDSHDYEETRDNIDGDASIDKKKKKHKKKKKKKKKKKPKKPKNPDLHIPSPPTKGTPPGPAYSPQPFTLTGYTQYFANLTHINNDYAPLPNDTDTDTDSGDLDGEKWREGKHKGKNPKEKPPHPRKFKYEVEYNTFSDKAYNLKDLTVKSYLKLAHRIGKHKSPKGNQMRAEFGDDVYEDQIDDGSAEREQENVDIVKGDEGEEVSPDFQDEAKKNGKKHKKKKKKKHHKKHTNKVWLQFIRRAFVGTLEEDQLKNFGSTREGLLSEGPKAAYQEQTPMAEVHDGEL